MKLRILGCDGGRGMGYENTTLLFNDHILIDAGTIQTALTMEEALDITDIFFTHSHLDHIVDLPFLMDATFGSRPDPLHIYGIRPTIDAFMTHLFNNSIWPDFSKLPTKDSGQFDTTYIKPEVSYTVGDLTFTPIEVNHTIPCVGYKVEDDDGAIIFSGDTGPTDKLWEIANETENLKAVIVDLSFPVSEQYIADISGHMTAQDVEKELKKLKKDCDVYTFHYKVGMGTLLAGQAKRISHFGKPLKPLRLMETLEI
jgi:ribonuclease BN (tRNA processing enzyme)